MLKCKCCDSEKFYISYRWNCSDGDYYLLECEGCGYSVRDEGGDTYRFTTKEDAVEYYNSCNKE
jgi:hypothetical protein